MTSCDLCGRPHAGTLARCLRCRAAFAGLRLVDLVDEAIDEAIAPDTVVAIGYPPSLREVTRGDDR
jgi:hypothetical protein